MRVLVACEFSGRVRSAFRELGHDAWSCDLLAAEDGGPHIQANVLDVLYDGWDLMIAHPPCTYLAVSGARWFKDRVFEQACAVDFALTLYKAPISYIALENPISILSSFLGKPSQIIHPWMFGHGEVKATCLWLKGLRPLVSSCIVPGREARVHKASPGPERWKFRSRTLPGVAKAMAVQWSNEENFVKEEVKVALRDMRRKKREINELKELQATLARQTSPDAKIVAMIAEELRKLGALA